MTARTDAWLLPVVSRIPSFIQPAHLSILRAALLIPVYLTARETPWLAVGFVVLSSCCDLFDGPLARFHFNATELGASLDAFCDKVFVIGCVFFPCWNRTVAWLAWIVLLLELSLIAIRPIKRLAGVSMKSNMFGAWKTWLQSIAIGFLLIPRTSFNIIGNALLLFASLFAITSLGSHAWDIGTKKTS